MEDARKPPMFFKFFTAQHSSERMKIPPAFVDYMEGRRPREISLMGPTDDSWMVDLIEEEGALYFAGGWPEFVEDNSIQTGDFLVFQYDGEAGFKVQVFDPTMCPREASFHAWNSHRVTTELTSSNGAIPIKKENNTVGARGFSDGDHFSFQITMKAFHVEKAIWPIPRWFSQRHIQFHQGNINVMLCNHGGKQWPVSMIRRKDITERESWYLSKGLTAFIREDRIKEGDTCTFELVSSSLLRVCISRV